MARLYDFLTPVNKPAAAGTVQALAAAPASLLVHPRIGEKLDEFDPREVRRLPGFRRLKERENNGDLIPGSQVG